MMTTAGNGKNLSMVLDGMIGHGPAMSDVYRLTRQVSATSATVLLMGETGTGKELVARALHELSPRSSGPFIRVNCGALSESLLESELFGHVKGAFTSANENRTGRFEAAHGGTIFLDEINSMSYTLKCRPDLLAAAPRTSGRHRTARNIFCEKICFEQRQADPTNSQ